LRRLGVVAAQPAMRVAPQLAKLEPGRAPSSVGFLPGGSGECVS
jgi:hypothetical protein